MAWLSAVPSEDTDNTKKKTTDKRSRYTRFVEGGADEFSHSLQMPEVLGADYLVSLLNEVGPVDTNGMGVTPVGWTEMFHWIELTGLELSPWECLTIRELSQAYATEYSQSSDKNRPPPFSPEVISQTQRDKVSNMLGAFLRSFKKENKA